MNNNGKPKCVGIIIDGNRRWAKERGMPSLLGHREGMKRVEEMLSWIEEEEIEHLVIYCFSTENWNRSSEEVSYLMDMFKEVIEKNSKKLKERGCSLRIAGETGRFNEDIQNLVRSVNSDILENPKLTVTLCFSYGGRDEILSAINEIVSGQYNNLPITADEFEKHLWTSGIPDPDIIIRTGGEKRLSNFLTWKSVYSELFFLDKMWPDFVREDFVEVVNQYVARARRYGK